MKTKRRVIILEGVDKTGKSTISEKLLKKVPGAILIKQNRKELSNLKQIFLEMCLTLEKLPGDGPIILDRFYPSQMVYSILRNEEDITDKFYYNIEEFMLNHKELEFEIVYCTADNSTLEKRFIKDKEEYIKQDQINLLKTRYEHFLNKTQLKVTVFDSSD